MWDNISGAGMANDRKRTRRSKRIREVAASDLKNSWHTYLERVEVGREEVVITRYGQPIARLIPVDEGATGPGILGFLAGTVTVVGDLTAPTGETWSADGS
jgi:prevent-host-death family protein